MHDKASQPLRRHAGPPFPPLCHISAAFFRPAPASASWPPTLAQTWLKSKSLIPTRARVYVLANVLLCRISSVWTVSVCAWLGCGGVCQFLCLSFGHDHTQHSKRASGSGRVLQDMNRFKKGRWDNVVSTTVVSPWTKRAHCSSPVIQPATPAGEKERAPEPGEE